ncbi:alpha/beta hydrolase [Phenylobacterium sp.]|uniref:alpha/beta hydrolase family protein n=1 Tax=Phenylobacterium sp. TaxID=1871053 RepID=UPI0030F37F24
MASRKFDFENAAGRQLSGVLEARKGPVRGWAVFAHCFTCGKASLAATRVSRALAASGIGVLRFDFTGLGESDGRFGGGLSADTQDVVSAARAMQREGMSPQLLVGHSFGGAAVLAAASDVSSVKAVAVIGAPFAADHVLTHLGPSLSDAAPGTRVPVTISGRKFELGADFVRDVCSQDQAARIADLKRALLVLHAPTDEVVSIDSATAIFGAARHPKSFVSLDDADHLLTRKADSLYVSAVISAWVSRYLGESSAAP